jgi:tellurite resistance protein TehA-like permease
VERWRHLRGRVPFIYGPEYWALVFPSGIYAVAASMLVKAMGLTFLNGIAEFFLCAALMAWAITLAGMIHAWCASFHRSISSESAK